MRNQTLRFAQDERVRTLNERYWRPTLGTFADVPVDRG